MLDRSKVMKQLQTLSQKRFVHFANDLEIMKQAWVKIKDDADLSDRFKNQTYTLVTPYWQGSMSQKVGINASLKHYAVAAVDGSQIYYDKHQGVPCYVLNIGTVGLKYGYPGKAVFLDSEPHVFMSEDGESDGVETINLKRELYELRQLLHHSQQTIQEIDSREKYVAICDGPLLFFYVDVKNKQIKTNYFDRYIDVLMQMYDQNIFNVGYISFPKSKELVNVFRLVVADFDESLALSMKVLSSIVDADIAELFLQPGERTVLFQTQTSLVDLYPDSIKPYFCYMNVGEEIVRVELPAWIARDSKQVDHVCAMLLDQARKGRGYPVCLFEAHEQAVIKGGERSFFYQLLHNSMQMHNMKYKMSQKQLRKQKPFI